MIKTPPMPESLEDVPDMIPKALVWELTRKLGRKCARKGLAQGMVIGFIAGLIAAAAVITVWMAPRARRDFRGWSSRR